MILDQIKKPNDIKAVDKELYDKLKGYDAKTLLQIHDE